MRRSGIVVFAAIVLACLAIPRRASASDWLPEPSGGDLAVVGGIALFSAGILVTDIVFTVHDANLASHGVAPPEGWAIAETAVGGLQTVGAVAAFASFGGPPYDDNSAYSLGLIPGTWLANFGVHGVWALSAPNTRPSLLLAGSYAVAADMLLTTWAVKDAASGRLAGPSHAIMELLLTAPQVALSVYGAVTTASSSEHAGLIALASWSGALFMHGALSLSLPSKEPPPALPTTPPEVTFELAPAMLGAGSARAPGMQVHGAF